MRTALRLVVAAALAASIAAGPASSRPSTDFEIDLVQGDDAVTVESGAVGGVNLGHFAGTEEGYPCADQPTQEAYCQSILVKVTNPFTEADARKGRERANLDLTLVMEGAGDLALLVYEADEDGTRGEQVASSDGIGESTEATAVAVATKEGDEVRWYRVEVFFHAFTGSWSLDASFA